jgi:cytochrome c peroxidase
MSKRRWVGIVTVGVALVAGAAGARSGPAVTVDATRLRVFEALPASMDSASNQITESKVVLGRMLYYEPRLSKGQDISCNTCHALTAYGAEEEAVSTGHKGQKGTRNAPTVYNAAGHFAQFWDGRSPTVEEQAKGPILNPVEMAMTDQTRAIAVLKSMPEYVKAFRTAFPGEKDPVTYDNVGKAIGAFERRLVTNSRWDKFLRGDRAALTDPEKAGLDRYLDVGCQACHSGIYLGGSMFQKLGAVKPWKAANDLGRFAVTKQDADKMFFKVPTLRNVEKTGPYYHDGSVLTLEEAVSRMGEHQLGRQLGAGDVASIVTFLKALTGELPAEYIKAPALPKSTARTPKPDKT